MKSKIISNVDDRIGLIFYNTVSNIIYLFRNHIATLITSIASLKFMHWRVHQQTESRIASSWNKHLSAIISTQAREHLQPCMNVSGCATMSWSHWTRTSTTWGYSYSLLMICHNSRIRTVGTKHYNMPRNSKIWMYNLNYSHCHLIRNSKLLDSMQISSLWIWMKSITQSWIPPRRYWIYIRGSNRRNSGRGHSIDSSWMLMMFKWDSRYIVYSIRRRSPLGNPLNAKPMHKWRRRHNLYVQRLGIHCIQIRFILTSCWAMRRSCCLRRKWLRSRQLRSQECSWLDSNQWVHSRITITIEHPTSYILMMSMSMVHHNSLMPSSIRCYLRISWQLWDWCLNKDLKWDSVHWFLNRRNMIMIISRHHLDCTWYSYHMLMISGDYSQLSRNPGKLVDKC